MRGSLSQYTLQAVTKSSVDILVSFGKSLSPILYKCLAELIIGKITASLFLTLIFHQGCRPNFRDTRCLGTIYDIRAIKSGKVAD